MTPLNFSLRMASSEDAVTISALSIQVFLDTYATEGVRPDLALEAHSEYSVDAFAQRHAEPQRRFVLAENLAEMGNGLLGFAEVLLTSLPCPAGDLTGAELVRLYVQPKAQRMNLGRSLLTRAEQLVQAANIGNLWLTAWEGNHNARAFYERVGYEDVGATTYTFQGQTYPNRVLAKRFAEATRFAI
jgi:diamine N-acetyltransferase